MHLETLLIVTKTELLDSYLKCYLMYFLNKAGTSGGMKQIFVYFAYNASEMELNVFCCCFFKKMIPPLFLLHKLTCSQRQVTCSFLHPKNIRSLHLRLAGDLDTGTAERAFCRLQDCLCTPASSLLFSLISSTFQRKAAERPETGTDSDLLCSALYQHCLQEPGLDGMGVLEEGRQLLSNGGEGREKNNTRMDTHRQQET